MDLAFPVGGLIRGAAQGARFFFETKGEREKGVRWRADFEAERAEEAEKAARWQAEFAAEQERFLQKREDADKAHFLKSWPFAIPPGVIIESSSAHQNDVLNIILHVVDTSTPKFLPDGGQLVNEALEIFNGTAHEARLTVGEFDNVFLYAEPPQRESRLTADALRNTVWNMLRAVPTVFIEVNLPSPDLMVLYNAHWGGALASDVKCHRAKPQKIALPSFEGYGKETLAPYREAMALMFSSLVAVVGDGFHALQRPDNALHTPIFPALAGRFPSQREAELWEPMTAAYLSLCDRMAARDPLQASEFAAKSALAAHDAGAENLAAQCLEKARALHPLLSSGAPYAVLHRQRRDNAPSALESALIALQPGFSLGEAPPIEEASSPPPSFEPFEDVMCRLRPVLTA